MSYSSSSSTTLNILKSPQSSYDYMPDQTINPLLICCVCNKPFVNPVTANGKQRGCHSCFSSNDGPFEPITEWIVIEMLNGLLVRCTECEETNIRRDALEKHKQNVCKRAIVLCKAADIKCQWKGEREQLEKHLATCIFEPLRPALAELLSENRQLQEWIEKLEHLIKDLREQQ